MGKDSRVDNPWPALRIREIDGRVRLGLDGFGDVEGETLQDAADELVALLLGVAMALRADGIGPICSDFVPDAALLDFVWEIGEVAASGHDPRGFLFGPGDGPSGKGVS